MRKQIPCVEPGQVWEMVYEPSMTAWRKCPNLLTHMSDEGMKITCGDHVLVLAADLNNVKVLAKGQVVWLTITDFVERLERRDV